MKILLINPPIPPTCYNTEEFYLPSGLLYLAAVLIKNGEKVKILDLKTFKNKPEKPYGDIIIDVISSFQPELVGIGGLYSGNFPDELKYSLLIKKSFPEVPIVIGGIHATIYAIEILKNCLSIDWVILGEGEGSIIQLVDTLKSKRVEFDKINGFAYRKNGEIILTPQKEHIKNPDNIPFPAYNLIDLKDYYVDTSNWHNPKKLPINTSIPIISSRSCPHQCPFCCMYMVMGPRWRARSPENVVEEIEYLYHSYNHRHFSFMDDNFTFGKSRILEICNLINKRRLNIQFETPNGLSIRTMDEEMVDALVSAGMVRTSLAIESGSDFIRNKIMKKNLSREKIFEIIGLIKKYAHLYVSAFFIIGMPEETEETLMDTYNMIKEIHVNKIQLQNIAPFPGTRVFEQALRDNLFVDIELKDLYKSDVFDIKKDDRFFIKPYKLDLEKLREFRSKCNDLIAGQNLKRAKQRSAFREFIK